MRGARHNPGSLVIFGNPRRRAARNQEPEAAVSETREAVDVYTDFHGHDPRAILELQRSVAVRLDYAGLGPLLGLGFALEGVDPPAPDKWDEYPLAVAIGRETGLVLASNALPDPDDPAKVIGTQLYAIGGRQGQFLDVARELGLDTSKDILDLGPLAFVVYEDQKPGDTMLTEYVHAFDEPQPALGYDRLKEEIFFAGGAYRIEGLWLHQ